MTLLGSEALAGRFPLLRESMGVSGQRSGLAGYVDVPALFLLPIISTGCQVRPPLTKFALDVSLRETMRLVSTQPNSATIRGVVLQACMLVPMSTTLFILFVFNGANMHV